jgi:hypothetical protein
MPSVIKNDSLIIDSAIVSRQNIYINEDYIYHYDINDADGIQFFKKTRTIKIGYTHIRSLPNLVSDSLQNLSIFDTPLQGGFSLDSLPNLRTLSFNYDSIIHIHNLDKVKKLVQLTFAGIELDTLPPLDSLSNLQYISVIESNGHFHRLPNLSYNKKLVGLYLFDNSIDSIPSLDSCRELALIDLTNNKVKRMPQLSNNKKLQQLILGHNQLSSLPDVSQSSKLQYLLANNNKIDSLPDLSHNRFLNWIDLDSNRLNSMPDLSSLSSLNILHASANMLSQVPAFNTATVTDLDLSHNMLTSFPIPFYTTPSIWRLNDNLIKQVPDSYTDSFGTIDVSQNKLDFSSASGLKQIDDLAQYASYSFFDYSHQKPFGDRDTVTVLTYSDTILTIADQHYADSYQWYHDGRPISGATDTILHIYCATQADAGTYICHSIGQYFNSHSFRFNYGITEFESEPQTLMVSPTIGKTKLVTLYPTVSGGLITLRYSLPEPQSVTFRVYDTKGSLVYDSDLSTLAHSEYRQVFDLSGMASGSYIAHVQYSLGYSQNLRLVIMQQ